MNICKCSFDVYMKLLKPTVPRVVYGEMRGCYPLFSCLTFTVICAILIVEGYRGGNVENVVDLIGCILVLVVCGVMAYVTWTSANDDKKNRKR